MSNEELSYAEQFAILQQEYCDELPDILKDIDDAWLSYCSGNNKHENFEELFGYIHRITGSAGTFGFPELSNSARSIEQALSKNIYTEKLAESLQQELQEKLYLLQKLGAQIPPQEQQNILVKKDSEQPLIYLFEDDQTYAKNLVLRLSHYGYEVLSFSDTQMIYAAIKEQIPDLFIIDVVVQDEQFGGLDFLNKIQSMKNLNVPIIICSSRTDFETRFRAVRAGADAYMVKPLDIDYVVNKIDDLLGRKPKRPYQIMIIDDDVNLAQHYKLVLRQAGMQVQITNRPRDVIAAMNDFPPDVILMDLYMPECSGFDLAKVIRQQQQFDSIPIVFLSTEFDTDKQLVAMRVGGDEFLTKPITDEHLETAVLIRAERARLLSELAMQDSLTGLLNHAKLKEQLALSVSRAQRSYQTFGFVMIDIDHFKAVNDNYGHMVGDRIIKSMAQLLRKRLRKNDVIGRYGGEEFAVIIDNCSHKDACTLINSIREDFSDQSFQNNEKEFNVTFSAGVAMYPDYTDAEALNQAADEALYRAKNSGRNKVE